MYVVAIDNSSYISLSLDFVNFLTAFYASINHMQYEFRFQNSEYICLYKLKYFTYNFARIVKQNDIRKLS